MTHHFDFIKDESVVNPIDYTILEELGEGNVKWGLTQSLD